MTIVQKFEVPPTELLKFVEYPYTVSSLLQCSLVCCSAVYEQLLVDPSRYMYIRVYSGGKGGIPSNGLSLFKIHGVIIKMKL